LELNEIHRLLVCYGDNLLGETTEILFDASKEVSLEVDAAKTKYRLMATFRNQNGEQDRNRNVANKAFENLLHFKYSGIAVTNQIYIHDEVKCR
jgi:hypothetical protein